MAQVFVFWNNVYDAFLSHFLSKCTSISSLAYYCTIQYVCMILTHVLLLADIKHKKDRFTSMMKEMSCLFSRISAGSRSLWRMMATVCSSASVGTSFLHSFWQMFRKKIVAPIHQDFGFHSMTLGIPLIL